MASVNITTTLDSENPVESNTGLIKEKKTKKQKKTLVNENPQRICKALTHSRDKEVHMHMQGYMYAQER